MEGKLYHDPTSKENVEKEAPMIETQSKLKPFVMSQLHIPECFESVALVTIHQGLTHARQICTQPRCQHTSVRDTQTNETTT